MMDSEHMAREKSKADGGVQAITCQRHAEVIVELSDGL